jgi:hypothetical protein
MKRLHLNYALAWLLAATCAHAAAQTTSAGVADPQAPVPPTTARPAIDDRTDPAPPASPAMPMHEHHAGMDMGAMQCKAGSGDKPGGCGGMQCMAGGKCGCCAGMTMKDGGDCCGHKETK